VVTAVAVAVNGALDAPAATVTDAGTVTAVLLLAKFTVSALAVAPVSVIVHASVTAPVTDALAHVIPLTPGCPVPLSAIVEATETLLVMVTVPLTAPATVGSKPIVSTAVWFGLRVIGALIPDTENPAPATVAPLRISCAVPEDVIVTVFVAAAFRSSVPNATLVALKLSAGAAGFSCRAKVSVMEPAVAVRVAVCAVVTAVVVAVNQTLVTPAATVTEAGTVNALLLLVSVTAVGVVGADVSVTVHASVPAPVSDALAQETALSVAGPSPFPVSVIVPGVVALLPIVTNPIAVPVVVGLNPIVRVAVCPGYSNNGVLIPDTENPAPATDTAPMVTTPVPVDVSVTACVVGVFSNSPPNATLELLKPSVCVTAFNCTVKDSTTPPAAAVRVEDCVTVTAFADAINPALEAPAAMVTVGCTVIWLLRLLARFTVRGPAVAPVSVTVHASVAPPVSDGVAHVSPLSPGCPVPPSAIVPPLVALLLIVTVPLAAPATAGSNPTVSVAVWPGFSVNGVLIPDTENPVPVTEIPLIVSAAVPEDVTVTSCVDAAFSSCVPNVTFVELRLSPGIAAFSCSPKVPVTPPAVAVRVAVCAVLTADADAVNPALDAPAATVTEAGTVTALLLLERLTGVALAATPVSVTVQVSVAVPVSDALVQETPLTAGCPVPLSAIVPPLVALLPIVTVPLAAPAVVGSNPMVSVAVWPGVSVNGVLIPDAENPAPVTEIPLIVSAAVPDEVTVTSCVVAAFSCSVPNATFVELRLRPGTAAFSCSPYVAVPLALAVSVAVCAVVTADTVAVNPALDAPAATVTDAGTVTEALLLAKATVRALAVTPVSVTVHASVAVPVNDALVQETALSAGCPVPLSAIVPPLVALLAIVTVPLAAPAVVGSNPTVSVAVWPGFSVNGVLIPETENPVPVSETPPIVSAAVPDEVTVTACVVAAFSCSVPNTTFVELRLRPGTAAFSCSP
jgi:hypothetical protein